MNRDSQIISRMTGVIYPFLIMFGFYIIINGHISPGGGFQGGAVLATVFISRYLVFRYEDIRINSLKILEKVFFVLIVLIPWIFVLYTNIPENETGRTIYLILMNLLIGFKVFCGLSIIFFRFVFYESGEYSTTQ